MGGSGNGNHVGGLTKVWLKGNANKPVNSPENQERQQDIHGRSGNGDHDALPARFGEIFVIGASALFDDIVARHAHVAAKGKALRR